ncbi:hypothetical protein QBC44DRAFT_84675 [Cladorrhinum sp. PSN332]|nr:hypothetical protein QBC44DRAFT_84675 [Cladorrhinum sp. PSN332]
MVQLIPGITPATSSINRNPDPLNDLTVLLNRLQRTIIHADAEREARLKDNEYEREKAQQNINYARSLLTKIEHEALSVKIHTRRQSLQADLVRKRELLDQLSERLSDLAEFAAATSQTADDENELDTSDDGEDILADIIATPSESLESTRSTRDGEEPEDTPPQSPVVAPQPPPPPAQIQSKQDLSPPTISTPSSVPSTQTTSSLRPRHTQNAPAPPPSSSPSAETTSRSALFGAETSASSSTAVVKTTEAILDHQRSEQDALSESILKLASDLKASSQAFSQSLEEDKELVEKAGEGMNKTGEGMDAVTSKMGMLQRMTEGKGWWGRMYLYAMVYGLMVALVLFVGVMPKLRF